MPRIIPVLGLVGAPLLIASALATMFGINDQTSVFSVIMTLPVAAWELSLGVWLVVKGFKRAPILADLAPQSARETGAR